MDSTRTRRTLTTIAITAALVVPTAAWATGGFDDVSSSDYFATGVQWMQENGVTVGCNPPENTRYCPDDFVTRGQMALFLQRLDTNDVFVTPDELPPAPTTPESAGPVDADTLDGLDSTDLLPRFAVLKYNLGAASLLSDRGLVSWTRESAGKYVFEFDRDVSACAWQVTPGARNNATFGTGHSFWGFAHSVSSSPAKIRVQLHDEDGDDADTSFNLTVSC